MSTLRKSNYRDVLLSQESANVILGESVSEDELQQGRVFEVNWDGTGHISEILEYLDGKLHFGYQFSARGSLIRRIEWAPDAVHDHVIFTFARGYAFPPTEARYYVKRKSLSRKIGYFENGAPRVIEYFKDGSCYCRETLDRHGNLDQVRHFDPSGLAI